MIDANLAQHWPLPPPPSSAVIAHAPCWCQSSAELISTTSRWHISPANQGCMWRRVILQQAPRPGFVKEGKKDECVGIMTGLRSEIKPSFTRKALPVALIAVVVYLKTRRPLLKKSESVSVKLLYNRGSMKNRENTGLNILSPPLTSSSFTSLTSSSQQPCIWPLPHPVCLDGPTVCFINTQSNKHLPVCVCVCFCSSSGQTHSLRFAMPQR